MRQRGRGGWGVRFENERIYISFNLYVINMSLTTQEKVEYIMIGIGIAVVTLGVLGLIFLF